jgi:hypothetical protein
VERNPPRLRRHYESIVQNKTRGLLERYIRSLLPISKSLHINQFSFFSTGKVSDQPQYEEHTFPPPSRKSPACTVPQLRRCNSCSLESVRQHNPPVHDSRPSIETRRRLPLRYSSYNDDHSWRKSLPSGSHQRGFIPGCKLVAESG